MSITLEELNSTAALTADELNKFRKTNLENLTKLSDLFKSLLNENVDDSVFYFLRKLFDDCPIFIVEEITNDVFTYNLVKLYKLLSEKDSSKLDDIILVCTKLSNKI
jgi:hypothetical protein